MLRNIVAKKDKAPLLILALRLQLTQKPSNIIKEHVFSEDRNC